MSGRNIFNIFTAFSIFCSRVAPVADAKDTSKFFILSRKKASLR
nr:MAG TPA: hypothetical protein [Caudoviricetes sp.]